MKFNYQARTKEGEIRAGTIEASSKEAALVVLQRQGVYVTYLKEAKPPIYAREVKVFKKITSRDLVLFSRQLSIMFGSKVPLVEALNTLAIQADNLDFQEKILSLAREIEGGSSLSKALSRQPDIFSPFYIAMVKSGEASGKLAESLTYLAEHLEREYHLKGRITGALTYPGLVLVVSLVILTILIFFIIPNFDKLIVETGVTVPKITQIVLTVSLLLRKFGLFIFLGFIIFLLLMFRYSKTEKGQIFFDKNFLKLPFFGPVFKIMYLSRFAENFSTLISGGLFIPRALEIVADIVGNSIYKKAILLASEEVKKGVPISSILANFPEIFPPVFVQMCLVGEKTGTLDNSLLQIAAFYQREMEREIERFLSVLEPVLIIILGVMVAGLMLSILLPLYKMIVV